MAINTARGTRKSWTTLVATLPLLSESDPILTDLGVSSR